MPDPTTATLRGPAFTYCDVSSSQFNVSLDNAATQNVIVHVFSSEATDILSPSVFTILAGKFAGDGFNIQPKKCGDRSITITTNPVLALVGSPLTFHSYCFCPDDTGIGLVTFNFGFTELLFCPTSFSASFSASPKTSDFTAQLYCSTDPVFITFTE